MTEKRKKAEASILGIVKKVTANDKFNIDLYTNLFKRITDKEFDALMLKFKNNSVMIQVVVPNNGKVKLSVERNIKILESMGRSFFHHINYGPSGSKADGTYRPGYKTKEKFMVCDLPWRRTSQLLIKGITVSKDNHTIDLISGQVTGESKSAKLTKPEIELLLGLGLTDTVAELLKIRGGDLGAARAFEASILRTGTASQKSVNMFATGVESTKTLKNYFLAAHLKTTL